MIHDPFAHFVFSRIASVLVGGRGGLIKSYCESPKNMSLVWRNIQGYPGALQFGPPKYLAIYGWILLQP